jgi:hypothetical protein
MAEHPLPTDMAQRPKTIQRKPKKAKKRAHSDWFR